VRGLGDALEQLPADTSVGHAFCFGVLCYSIIRGTLETGLAGLFPPGDRSALLRVEFGIPVVYDFFETSTKSSTCVAYTESPPVLVTVALRPMLDISSLPVSKSHSKSGGRIESGKVAVYTVGEDCFDVFDVVSVEESGFSSYCIAGFPFGVGSPTEAGPDFALDFADEVHGSEVEIVG